MRVPRHARVFSGRLDAAPFAGVFFCLLILIVLAGLIRTPGVRVELPQAEGLPAPTSPVLAVALDTTGQVFFENQIMDRPGLRDCLRAAVRKHTGPLTLVLQADKAVPYEKLLEITLIARECGVQRIHLAALPRPFAPAEKPTTLPP